MSDLQRDVGIPLVSKAISVSALLEACWSSKPRIRVNSYKLKN